MEAEFVDWLARRLSSRTDVTLGIGDDAAVYLPGTTQTGDPAAQVVTTDLLCEGVHFVWDQTTPGAIGRKALAVNLSDLAAMAARPRAAVVALLWSKPRLIAEAQALYEGLLELADAYRVAVIGGDTNTWTGPLVISVTLFGDATERGVLTRRGAQPGDIIMVTGQLGGSLAGHHLTSQPRVAEALQLHEDYALHAGMDISDGLALDLHRLTEASGVGAELELSKIPISDAARQLSTSSGKSPLQHALGDGEDFELLIIAAESTAARMLAEQPLDVPLTRIGTIVPDRGLWWRDDQQRRMALPITGYLH